MQTVGYIALIQMETTSIHGGSLEVARASSFCRMESQLTKMEACLSQIEKITVYKSSIRKVDFCQSGPRGWSDLLLSGKISTELDLFRSITGEISVF